jgi:hypothetical protein
MINNAVYDERGRETGYRCSVCQEIKPSMWGTVCNLCRERRRLASKEKQ